MAREIDKEAIADGTLTYAEAKYLKDRGRLPAGYEMPENDEAEDEDEPVVRPSRVVPLEEQDQLEMDDEDEDDSEPAPTKYTPLEEQTQLQMENRGGIVDDDDEESETYSTEDGWTNDKRRAELSKRGLSVSGTKEDLIGRLRRSDSDTLEDGDRADA